MFSIDGNSIACGMFLQVKFKNFRNIKIKNRGGEAGKRMDLKERKTIKSKGKAGIGWAKRNKKTDKAFVSNLS